MSKTMLTLLVASQAAGCYAASVLAQCMSGIVHAGLPAQTVQRVEAYVSELLDYNERTNVYSKAAYGKLPFHVADSLELAQLIASEQPRGVLDLGSGSGLPSMLIACVLPDVPVYAVESKSRKTRFLRHAAKATGLECYTPLTQNVRDLSRAWYFDVSHVTAKAFKPLNEVGPIGRDCIGDNACLRVPISESQAREFELEESQLHRSSSGEFLFYTEQIEPSRSVAQRKRCTREAARLSRL